MVTKNLTTVLLLTLGALTFTMPVNAQWVKKTTTTTNLLESIYFTDSLHGYACGWKGTVLKTNNAGETWTSISTTPNLIYKDVHFVDTLKGLIVGEDQFIFKTYNGGQNWVQKNTGSDLSRPIQSIDAYQQKNMVAVGFRGYIIQSNDTGNTWKLDSISLPDSLSKQRNLYDVTILPGGRCFAVGDSSLILSKNLTDTVWQSQFIGLDIALKGVSFVNDSIGFAAGGTVDTNNGTFINVFYKTTDGGKTWSTATSINNGGTINHIHFVNKDTGYITANSGRIFRTYNGGDTWVQLLSGTPSTLYRIFFYNNNGFICGDGGIIIKTSNNGGYPVSIPKLNNTDVVTLYPNPAKHTLYIGTEEVTIKNIVITDATGRRINLNKTNNNSLNISNLAKGIYTVTVYYYNLTDNKTIRVLNKKVLIN